MPDIELVIRIPEDEYRNVLATGKASFCVVNAIEAGTILPKGHGMLKDADMIDDNIYDLTRGMDLDYSQIISVLDDAPTIIEADNESEDKA